MAHVTPNHIARLMTCIKSRVEDRKQKSKESKEYYRKNVAILELQQGIQRLQKLEGQGLQSRTMEGL